MNEIESTEIIERDNLAVVAVVERLEPIEGKDFVECVHLKDVGYTFICEKIHKVGDKVVYIKYDTVVPNIELFAFLEPSKFRVKAKAFTHKDSSGNVIGKTYSQGIVLPLGIVVDDINDVNEGCDLTALLEIKKYIPPATGNAFGNMMQKGEFPTHIINKTDEDNLSACVNSLFELQGQPVYFTLKSEGSSLTAYIDPGEGELNVCSRNTNLKEVEGSKFWEAVNKYNLKEKLKLYPHIAIQAELVGPKIQGNHHKLTNVDMHVFTLTDIRTRRRLNYDEMSDIIKDLELTPVKAIYFTNEFKIQENIENDNFDMNSVDNNTIWTFDRLQRYTDIQQYDNGGPAEGIVIRPCFPFMSQGLHILWSGKILNREYKI